MYMEKRLEKEQKLLNEFKDKISDVLKDDHSDSYLRKWLKARCNDVKKAEIMYRESMLYREKMDVDRLLNDYKKPEVLQKYLTGGFCGFDKEGCPVKVEMFGNLDMKGLMYSCKKTDFEKTKLQECETIMMTLKEQSNKLDHTVDGITVIFDMENVSSKVLWRPGLQMYLSLVKILEDNYPEMMKQMFVVNAPRIFPLLWKVCRPLISDDMRSKIHVLGGDHKKTLLKYIPDDQLPAYLGGSLQDEDGNQRCPSKICAGGEVPGSYYLTDLINTENMETVTIPKGDKLILDVQVDKPGSLLRWEFKTDDYDICFGVKYTGSDGSTEEVIPVEKVNCHMVPEDGSLTCEQPGTYRLIFDNSSSWVRGKTIRYNYDVEAIPSHDDIKDEVDYIEL